MIVFNEGGYHQINATVVNNARRGAFDDGEIDIEKLAYYDVGIGGVAI